MQFKPKRAHYTLLLPALALTLAACGDDIQAMTDGSSSGTTTGTTEIDPSTPSTPGTDPTTDTDTTPTTTPTTTTVDPVTTDPVTSDPVTTDPVTSEPITSSSSSGTDSSGSTSGTDSSGSGSSGSSSTGDTDTGVVEKLPGVWATQNPTGLATDALIHPAQTRAKVWVENALRPLPAGTVLGFPVDLAAVEASGVLSAEGLRRAALEPTLPGLPIVGDVSLGELARARYGDEVTTRLIDPLLGGIAAGDLDRMSLDAVAPQIAEVAHTATSLIEGLAPILAAAQQAGPVFAAPPHGMEQLVTALTERLAQQGPGGGQHFLGLGQQALARARERDAAGPPVEQRNAQLFLQRLDLAGDGRLGDVQRFGGACQVADLGHCDEGAQLVDLHAGSVREEADLRGLHAQPHLGAGLEQRQPGVVRLVGDDDLLAHAHAVAGRFAQKFRAFHLAVQPGARRVHVLVAHTDVDRVRTERHGGRTDARRLAVAGQHHHAHAVGLEGQRLSVHMRDLAVQAANTGTNDTAARTAANAEVTQLSAEIDRISSSTKFGQQSLLNGSFGVTAAIKTGFNATGTYTVPATSNFQINVNGGGAKTVNLVAGSYTGAQLASHMQSAIRTALTSGGTYTQAQADAVTVDSTTVGAGFSLSIKANLANTQTFTLTDGAGTPLAAQNLTGAITAASGTGGTFQVGSNAGDTISVALASVSATGLGINALDLVNSASTAITALDSAIASVSTTRGNLGAVQNRFESTINNLQVTTENLAASESRIRDTDMALEMTQFTRHQVLLQAGTAMLGQANQLPQSVLRLLQ